MSARNPGTCTPKCLSSPARRARGKPPFRDSTKACTSPGAHNGSSKASMDVSKFCETRTSLSSEETASSRHCFALATNARPLGYKTKAPMGTTKESSTPPKPSLDYPIPWACHVMHNHTMLCHATNKTTLRVIRRLGVGATAHPPLRPTDAFPEIEFRTLRQGSVRNSAEAPSTSIG